MAAIQINGTTRINNSGKGIFSWMNPGTSAPSGNNAGDIYFDNGTKQLKVNDGSGWKSV
tara:strand:+ start:2930 stop:3106 length:177 start_codon:yes stop_codon:yes gene_type:complete